jgi:hypothetical protein
VFSLRHLEKNSLSAGVVIHSKEPDGQWLRTTIGRPQESSTRRRKVITSENLDIEPKTGPLWCRCDSRLESGLTLSEKDEIVDGKQRQAQCLCLSTSIVTKCTFRGANDSLMCETRRISLRHRVMVVHLSVSGSITMQGQ